MAHTDYITHYRPCVACCHWCRNGSSIMHSHFLKAGRYIHKFLDKFPCANCISIYNSFLSNVFFESDQFFLNHWCCCCSVAKSCPTLCNSMDCSMPGFPVLHHLQELAQTHVHLITLQCQHNSKERSIEYRIMRVRGVRGSCLLREVSQAEI